MSAPSDQQCARVRVKSAPFSREPRPHTPESLVSFEASKSVMGETFSAAWVKQNREARDWFLRKEQIRAHLKSQREN